MTNDKSSRATVAASAVAIFLFALAIAGCNGDPHQRYIPTSEKALASLEAAMDHWKSGASVETIKTDQGTVDLYDARWRAGAKLESYEVLSEEPGGPHPTFVVKLKLKGKPREEESKYFVMGIEPILVFRAEDYKKASGMGSG
jgi:hypothetical protein